MVEAMGVIDKSGVCVVIPAFNEASRIAGTLKELHRLGWRTIVVDDGSTDSTADTAAAEGAVVLRHLINRGQGAAIQTGIAHALRGDYQIVVTFDADGQHLPADLAGLIEPIRAGTHDVVLGSRFLGRAVGIPLLRRWLLRGGIILDRWSTGLPLTDTHNGLRAFSRSALRQFSISEDGMAHASEILALIARARLRVIEVPCTVRYSADSLEKGQMNSAAPSILWRLFVARLMR